MVEWVKCTACGVPFRLPTGDSEIDGDLGSKGRGWRCNLYESLSVAVALSGNGGILRSRCPRLP